VTPPATPPAPDEATVLAVPLEPVVAPLLTPELVPFPELFRAACCAGVNRAPHAVAVTPTAISTATIRLRPNPKALPQVDCTHDRDFRPFHLFYGKRFFGQELAFCFSSNRVSLWCDGTSDVPAWSSPSG